MKNEEQKKYKFNLDDLLRFQPSHAKNSGRQVTGFLDFCQECAQLFTRATYLEIGSWVGESALMMGSFHFVEKIISIDQCERVLEPYNIRTRHLANRKDVTHITKKSALAVDDIPDDSIDILYIDGNHQYELVKQDLENYFPKLKPGGVLAGHDYNDSWPGAKRAIDEFCKDNGLEIHKTFIDTSWMIKLSS